MNTPILLITFNRPDFTRQVLIELLKANPEVLYVFQDGPRADRGDDVSRCAEVRSVIESLVPRHCNLHTFFSKENLGCGPGPATAINWFFSENEMGIILEDDCIPSKSLFNFYSALLQEYRYDDRIALITGTNARLKWKAYKCDYFFSKREAMTMGCWASWRRAWSLFDFEIKSWGDEKTRDLFRRMIGKKRFPLYEKLLKEYYDKPPKDVWDYQWAYARILNNKFSIVSSVNQMSNIGFCLDSTHTPEPSRRGNMQLLTNTFPLRPSNVSNDNLYEWVMFYRFSYGKKKSLFLKGCLKITECFFCR